MYRVTWLVQPQEIDSNNTVHPYLLSRLELLYRIIARFPSKFWIVAGHSVLSRLAPVRTTIELYLPTAAEDKFKDKSTS